MSEIFPELDPALAQREIGRRLWVFVPDHGHKGLRLFASRLACLQVFKDAILANKAEADDLITSETEIELAWFGAAYWIEVK